MKKLIKTILLMSAVVFLFKAPVDAQKIPSETWMGLYFGSSKIGYARFLIEQVEYEGKPGYRLESDMNTKMLVLGVDVSQNVDTTVYLDNQFAPVYQIFNMSSAGHSSVVTAHFTKEEIIAERESSGLKTEKRLPVPEGIKIIGDNTFLTPDIKLRVGDKMEFKMFNPITLSLDDIKTEVVKKEFVKLTDSAPLAFVIKSITPMGDMVSWQSEDGEMLKAVGPMGITMIRESKESALGLINGSREYTPPADLAVMTSVRTDTEIPNPREIRFMKVRLTGLTDKLSAVSDARQKVTVTENELSSAEYQITASNFPPRWSLRLPIRALRYQEHLGDTPYIETSNSEIADLAKQIVGEEKRSAKVISLIREWVHINMKVKGDIGIIRSSVDVLHAKEGVCRDYAILYTALARAAEVPTKLVAGLVFWEGGFFYHVWAESYVGKWVPMDATLPNDFVDAAHIKLTEGDSAMFDMIKAMGVIKAEIVEFH